MAKRPRKKNAMSTVNGTWKMWALGASGAVIAFMLSVIVALCSFIAIGGLSRVVAVEDELKTARAELLDRISKTDDEMKEMQSEIMLLKEGLKRMEDNQRDQGERFDTFQATLARLNTQTSDLTLSMATAMMNQQRYMQAANVPAETPKILQKPSP